MQFHHFCATNCNKLNTKPEPDCSNKKTKKQNYIQSSNKHTNKHNNAIAVVCVKRAETIIGCCLVNDVMMWRWSQPTLNQKKHQTFSFLNNNYYIIYKFFT